MRACVLVIAVALIPSAALAQTSAHFKQQLAAAAKKYDVKFVWDRTVRDEWIQCDPVDDNDLGRATGFLKYMETYPATFLRNIPLDEIVLCSNLRRREQMVGGVAQRWLKRFYVVSGTSSETFHHEMFHIADGVSDAQWKKITGFDYEGTERFLGHGRGGLPGALDPNLKGFLTDYSKASPKEDRAEIFSLLITRPSEVNKRTQADALMRKKVKFVKDYARSIDSSMNESFWKAR